MDNAPSENKQKIVISLFRPQPAPIVVQKIQEEPIVNPPATSSNCIKLPFAMLPKIQPSPRSTSPPAPEFNEFFGSEDQDQEMNQETPEPSIALIQSHEDSQNGTIQICTQNLEQKSIEQVFSPQQTEQLQTAIITIPKITQNVEVPQNQPNTTPVKLRIALQQPPPGKSSFTIPLSLNPIVQNSVGLQGLAPNIQLPLSPFQALNFPQTPMQFQQKSQTQNQRPKKLQVPLTQIYKISRRSISMKLDPNQLQFHAQMIYDFELNPSNLVEEWLSSLIELEYNKVAIEMKFNAKHIQIQNIYELDGTQRIKKFVFNEEEQSPQQQAQVHKSQFPNISLIQISDIEHQENNCKNQELINGNVKIKRKVIGLRPRKQSVADMMQKIKPKLTILLEYSCDQITQGSALRYVNYKDINGQKGVQRYIYTVDYNCECWMPQLIHSESIASPWHLKFVVPTDYMVISSGVQTQRSEDKNNDALHVYEVQKTYADKIGFICCKFPQITTIEQGKKYGCFLSIQKQQCFNQQFIVEIMEYLQNLLGVNEYPCKQVHLVFVPNLLAKKFPKQSISFGEGLHIFDEQILVRNNQIDKRHHFYKNVSGAITFDFFGSKVRENKPEDLWLITAIRERIGDRMKKKKCGLLLHKYQVMRQIEYLYKQMKNGAEMAPLQANFTESQSYQTHFYQQPLSDIFYRKCSLLMHMIESSIDEATLDKIFRSLYVDALEQNDGLLSQVLFRKKFKKICGMHPINYYKNWIWATSCPELELSYEFNKRNNSLDLTLKQTSAVLYGQSEHQNLSQKLDRIFQSHNIQGDLTQPLDSLFVDIKQAARRWFVGNINIVIYQIEGNGGEIIPQQHKMSLKEFKSTTTSHIPLQGKVKRTMNNRKKEDQVMSMDQIKNQSDSFGPFKMNEFELEDYPQETKNIFQDLDNSNPVLWIRVDPDMEFIRKVKIVQEKRNNWLWQLLREQDIIGQIEAVRRLHVYNEELVYEILKTVAGSENFFYKIRKQVMKTLRKMEIFTFNKFISHESFLLKMFNTNRMLPGDSINTFYKENDFSNILQYYMERALLKAISNCKEESLILTQDKQKEVHEKMHQRQKQVAQENGTQYQDDQSVEITPNTNAICLPIIDNKIIRQRRNKSRFDESIYKCTSETVAKMLLRVLEQNDNSENNFDDSFYLRDVIACLGRIDNLSMMPAIATEIYRQLKLDQISNSSPHFAITIGSIKGYFNLKKQLYRFKTEKEINLDQNHPKVQAYEAYLEDANAKLQEIKLEIEKLLMDQYQPLHVRLFIFMEEIKSLFKYRNQSFGQALIQILKIIYSLQERGQLMFAFYGLRDLVLYLEQKKFVGGKLNLIEVYHPSYRSEIKQRLWNLYVLPHAYLTQEYTYWTKRLIKRLYQNQIPDCEYIQPFNFDPQWSQTENEIQQMQNLQSEQVPTFIQPIQQSQVQITNYIQQPVEERANRILQERERAQSFGVAGGAFKIQIGIKQNANLSEDEPMLSDNEQVVVKAQTEIQEEDNESIIDPFADIKMSDPVMQRCWDVLGKIYYHFESTDFLEPITAEKFGQQFYDDYYSMIDNPMDISTIMERMKSNYYMDESRGNNQHAKEMFRRDVMLMFQNCKEFNERGSDIVKSADRLIKEVRMLWNQYGLN